jgi:hypothetical protein
MSRRHLQLNIRELAREMFGVAAEPNKSGTQRGEWVLRGVKKANAILAAQGREPLIFVGRYSTVAKIEQWLMEHPDFVATQVLTPSGSLRPPAAPTPQPLRRHRAA